MAIVVLGYAGCDLEPFEVDGVPSGKVKMLRNLYVNEQHRRQGYARALLTHIAAKADAEQYAIMLEPRSDEIELDVLLSMYAEHGFVELQADPLLLVRFPAEPDINLAPKKTTIAILNAAGVPFN